MTETVPGKPAASPRLSAYYELTKPGIVAFVVLTAGVSFHVAAGGRPALAPLLHTLLGVLLATSGALALNQYLERSVDGLMERTRTRPLPSGRLSPGEALLFGTALVLLGVGYLWAMVHSLPALLTLASALAYNGLYTPMKPRSSLATLVGAIPGAMPALIGWGAATGTLAAGAAVLFGIAFLWQLPHVLALAWVLRQDYERAGFRLVPPADPEGRAIGRQMILYSAALLPVSLLPTFLALTGSVYLYGALGLGLSMLALCVKAHREMSLERARQVFLGSLLYQPLLLGLMFMDTIRI